jgi:hypothetical protein
MPDGPFRSDSPGTYAETRASILTAKSGLPYPTKPTGMPSSGMTPPPRAPKSELFPELSELNLDGSEIGGASSLLSDRSAAGQTHVAGAGPSIASLDPGSQINHHDGDDDRASASSVIHDRDMDGTGYSELSLPDMSVAGTSVLAKERNEKTRRRQENTSDKVRAANLFLAERRELQQEQALMNPGSFQDMSQEVYHVSTATANSYNESSRRLGKEDTGHQVFDLGANPSMRSTPVLAHSAVASVLDPSHVGSALSSNNRPNSRPRFTHNAMPIPGDPMPEFVPHDDAEEDDDINTNPSIIQGPIGHHTHSWEMARNDFGVNVSDRGLNVDLGGNVRMPSISPRLASPRAGDEGYISAANPIGSPGSGSPIHGGDAGMRALDDMLSDPDFYHGTQRNRVGSGNSHGMPSPLYDSATGRGMDRIESKDIVALMEHVRLPRNRGLFFISNHDIARSSPSAMPNGMRAILKFW